MYDSAHKRGQEPLDGSHQGVEEFAAANGLAPFNEDVILCVFVDVPNNTHHSDRFNFGRVEPFKTGRTDLFQVAIDANSLYFVEDRVKILTKCIRLFDRSREETVEPPDQNSHVKGGLGRLEQEPVGHIVRLRLYLNSLNTLMARLKPTTERNEALLSSSFP